MPHCCSSTTATPTTSGSSHVGTHCDLLSRRYLMQFNLLKFLFLGFRVRFSRLLADLSEPCLQGLAWLGLTLEPGPEPSQALTIGLAWPGFEGLALRAQGLSGQAGTSLGTRPSGMTDLICWYSFSCSSWSSASSVSVNARVRAVVCR